MIGDFDDDVDAEEQIRKIVRMMKGQSAQNEKKAITTKKKYFKRKLDDVRSLQLCLKFGKQLLKCPY